MQPHTHGNNGFPFCINGYCSDGLAELQQSQHPQQQQQQQQQPQHHHQLHGQFVPTSTFASLFEKQRQQTDQFINTQNTQMKLMLQHQRELQVMARKNEEITTAEKKKKEMENILRSLELEKRELKKIYEEKGAIAITLRNKLEEEKNKKRLRMLVADDVESCCSENEEARAKKCAKLGNNVAFCRKCNTNSSGVLFLPCRHLSSCKACEALLQACPICGTSKKNVIEIQNLNSN
ncbi:RING-type E3 ubiquitin transferase [Trifolium repens]|nr:RING-type E3 ubiquitin transferase [Trifolium repens]